MNIQIAHAEYASAAENIAARKAIRQRIMSATTPPPKPKPVVINYRALPLWRRVDITFSDHVVAWQMHLARKASSPVIGYMRRRCEEMGADLDGVVSESRKMAFVKPRQLLMWELRNVLHLSYPQIARIFDRDHGTVIHNVSKVERERAG